MLRCTSIAPARFRPFAGTLQSRFRWRHREFDSWRRLMDATCFVVDWIGRPRGNVLSTAGGHWTHIITCAHVLAPWDYPNFYPPVGQTRFVSKITLADTMLQLRVPSLQGDPVYRHFCSQHHTFVHADKRLDLAVCHAEQFYKRNGDAKLLFLQNEGLLMRPRFELLEELEEGDIVWIYGCTARGDVYDDSEQSDPLMVPTGIRCRVKHLEPDHFFLDTTADPTTNEIEMGMCGSVVIKNGKCVGMLTSTVHEDSENVKLRGTAMCTYARDIRAFLLEVEQQMLNPNFTQNVEETVFQSRRKDEAVAGKRDPERVSKDWEADKYRLAHHLRVPKSQWQQGEVWTREEDTFNKYVYGKTSGFNQEVQENAFGLGMNESSEDGTDVEGHGTLGQDGKKLEESGMREDPSPTNHFIKHDEFARISEWDSQLGREAKDSARDSTEANAPGDEIDKLRRSVENMNRRREQEWRQRSTTETMTSMKREQTTKDWTKPPTEEARKRHERGANPFHRDAELDGVWDRH
jgi:hypothetical protein